MSTFTANNVSSGAVIYASDHNELGSRVAAVVNGGLDNNNIASGAAIDGSKLADDGVTDSKLDYPRWYKEVARTTLSGSATTMSVTSIPAHKYLKVIVYGIASGGNLATTLRFNNDSGNNYSLRISDNGAAHGTFTSQNGITLDPATNTNLFSEIEIVNLATQEKQITFHSHFMGAAGAGNVTSSREGWPKWVNTSDAITRIDVVTGSNNYGAGSEVIVLGHD